MQKISLLAATALALSAPAMAMPPPLPPVEGKDAVMLQAAMAERRINSDVITATYLDRIRTLDDKQPQLNAVIATVHDATIQPHALDL